MKLSAAAASSTRPSRSATSSASPPIMASPWQRQVKPAEAASLREQVAIVGAGPTGLSAAYYLARRGYPVTVFDAMPVAGGMMAIGIPDYRLPRAELNRDIDAIRGLGVEIRLNTAIGRDIALTTLQDEFDAVLLAVGAQRSQRLGIPGEELHGVMPATTFLKEYNLEPETTISGDVAVVGGGSTAMDAARSALRAGASKVHILYRRTQAEMPAQEEEVRAALEEGIELHELVAPVSSWAQRAACDAFAASACSWSQPESDGSQAVQMRGRRRYADRGQRVRAACDDVLVAIGEAPDPSFLPEGTSVVVAAWGGLLVNPRHSGDRRARRLRRRRHHLRSEDRHPRRRARTAGRARDPRLPAAARHRGSRRDARGRIRDGLELCRGWRRDARPAPAATSGDAARDQRGGDATARVEFAAGFTEEQARREASRCLRCDLAYLCPIGQTGRMAPASWSTEQLAYRPVAR